MALQDLLTRGVLGAASLPIAYYLFAGESGRRFFARARSRVPDGFAPAVSVLKPVRGADRHAFEHFSSFCRQQYPEFEILFAVEDETDPAIPVIRRLIDAYPERSIRLLVGVPHIGASGKVNKLCRLAREARHDLLVVSDSDITAPEDYLRAVVAPFKDPRVGAVTCVYRGVPDAGLPATLEAIGISTDFVPGVIVASRLEGVKFTLGATMATTRAHLAEIGGFEALADYCADDFELGCRIAARGHRVELAGCTVSTECAPAGFVELFRHQLRWAITVRHSRPAAYLGRAILAQGLPWAVAAAALAPSGTVSILYLMLYVVSRMSVVWTVALRGLHDESVAKRWWLVPVHDAFAFVVSVAACCSNRIEWRGRWFDLRRGRLVPVRHAAQARLDSTPR
jgi:ceramide glucosyltransferase